MSLRGAAHLTALLVTFSFLLRITCYVIAVEIFWDRCLWWVGQPSAVQYVCGSSVSHGSISDVLEEHVVGVVACCACDLVG